MGPRRPSARTLRMVGKIRGYCVEVSGTPRIVGTWIAPSSSNLAFVQIDVTIGQYQGGNGPVDGSAVVKELEALPRMAE
eukprot:5276402-Prorocentrum_lima.AAC.1